MKRLYFLLAGGLFLSLSLTSCQAPKPMDEATKMAKIDSVANSRMQVIADSAMNACTTNETMLVQMKADSLYNAAVAAMNAK